MNHFNVKCTIKLTRLFQLTFSSHSEFFVMARDQIELMLLVGAVVVLIVFVLVAIFTD